MTLCLALALSIITRLDPALTPGAIRPLTLAHVCSTRWGVDRRHVTESMKRHVATAYGLKREAIVGRSRGPCCEFDHLVPRSLGGADAIANLWPQPWAEATLKDALENSLHRRVCAGALSLRAAQQLIVRDWVGAYLRYREGS